MKYNKINYKNDIIFSNTIKNNKNINNKNIQKIK